MWFTIAKEPKDTVWPLEIFIQQRGSFSIYIDRDINRYHAIFREEGKRKTVTCMARNIRSYTADYILSNQDKFIIKILGDRYCLCEKWKEIDLGFFDNEAEDVAEIIHKCEVSKDVKFFSYQKDGVVSVIYEYSHGGTVIVAGKDQKNKFTHLKFDGVKD